MQYNTLKLIPFLLLLNASLEADTLKENIEKKQTQITTLQVELEKMQELEALLPINVEQREADLLAAQLEENALKTRTEFGYISTSGNTETKSYALDFGIKKGWDKHKFAYSLDGQYTEDNDIETKNKFLTELDYNYAFTDKFALSYLTGYKEDKFSGYNYQFYTGGGVKYKIIKEEKHDLSFESNILYSQDSTENTYFTSTGVAIVYPNSSNLSKDSSKTVKGTTESYSSARAKSVYEYQVLENLIFTQEASYRTDIEDTQNYFVLSKTAFASKLSAMFSLGVNYTIDYANRPPEGKENADKTLTASLIVDY